MATTVAEIEREATTTKPSSTKYVFFFGGGKAEGDGKMKDVLGGKGAGLAEMTNAGLPVPPGFTIQTEACREFMKTGKTSNEVDRQMKEALRSLETLQGQKLGGNDNPLLVSVRSGAKFSMPGIENFAPERTLTSNGFSPLPSFWPCNDSSLARAASIWLFTAAEVVSVRMYSRQASV